MRRNTKNCLFIAETAFLLAFVFSACSHAQEESALFWPPPPSEMRIIFVKSIYSAQDAGIKPNVFKKFKRLLAGKENERLNRPIAVAVDSDETIYVCDTGAVHVFNKKKKQYKKISAIGKQALASPVGVNVHPGGLVLISDSKLKEIFCLDKNLRLKFTLQVEGHQWLRPTGIAARKDKIYAVDTAAHQVFIFDLNGKPLSRFGRRG